MKVYPLALGRSDADVELHAWDPECGLGETYSGISSIRAECRWGAGVVEEDPALVLYVFDDERTIEVYFPNRIAVGPQRWMNAWDVLLSMRPETLVIAYGDKPTDASSRLKIEFGTLMEALYDFADQMLGIKKGAEQHPALTQLKDYFAGCMPQSAIIEG